MQSGERLDLLLQEEEERESVCERGRGISEKLVAWKRRIGQQLKRRQLIPIFCSIEELNV